MAGRIPETPPAFKRVPARGPISVSGSRASSRPCPALLPRRGFRLRGRARTLRSGRSRGRRSLGRVQAAFAPVASRSHPARRARALYPPQSETVSRRAIPLRRIARWLVRSRAGRPCGASRAWAARPALGPGRRLRARRRRGTGRPAAPFVAAFARPVPHPPRIPHPGPGPRSAACLRRRRPFSRPESGRRTGLHDFVTHG